MWVDFLDEGRHVNLDVYFVRNNILKTFLIKKEHL